MILVFGGTTEGRVAVDVCEQGTQPYYYATKSALQQVELHHGVRLTGAMTEADMVTFCREHAIRCLVDAAHPFAENLHRAIANVGLPVVRLSRQTGCLPLADASIQVGQACHESADASLQACREGLSSVEGIRHCRNFADAVQQLLHDCPRRLLALTGVNSIAKLSDYWQEHDTVFRILRRDESLQVASQTGLPADRVVYYNETLVPPSPQEERALMESVGCDAIITKDSGVTGGLPAKIAAAQSLGLKVYVVDAPSLPADWTYVTGQHTLRRALEHLVPGFFPLITGLTTGVCATAATKAALLSLLGKDDGEEQARTTVEVMLPDGEDVTVPVEVMAPGVAAVVKDSSDDPDVTRGCRIVATVAIHDNGSSVKHDSASLSTIRFLQGKGVGRVTLPGLGIPVGQPAINVTPRRMMETEIRSLTSCDVDVTLEVEGGEELAKHTFNERVGVVGGISIIGTSGIVRPMSNEAVVDSIARELEVVTAMGLRSVGLATGKKSEADLKTRELEARGEMLHVVLCGNFIGEALKVANRLGIRRVVIGLGIGKAVKLAEGYLDTHSHKVVMNRSFVREVAMATAPAACAELVEGMAMARELWEVMPETFFDRVKALCEEHCRTVFPVGELEVVLTKG